MGNGTDSAPLKWQTMQLILNEKDAHLIYLDTFKDAAVNAALALLNQRVVLLEEERKGDGFSLQDLFVDVLIAIALGPVAGALVAGFARQITKNIFKSELAVRKAFTQKIKFKEKVKIEREIVIADDIILRETEKINRKLTLTNKFPRDTSEESNLWQISIEAVGDGVREVTSDELRDFEPLPSQPRSFSSKAIGLVEIVENYFDRRKLVTSQIFNFLHTQISNDVVSDKTRGIIHRFLAASHLPYTSAQREEVKHKYILFFEAIMWVTYLEFVENLGKAEKATIMLQDPVEVGIGGSRRLVGYDPQKPISKQIQVPVIKRPKLADYLVRRLQHPDSKQGESFLDYYLRKIPIPQGFRSGAKKIVDSKPYKDFLPVDTRLKLEQDLINYLMKIKKELGTNPEKLWNVP